MRGALGLLLVLALAACKPAARSEPALPPLPHQTLATDCARAGGSVMPLAGGLLACLRETKDSGKACTRGSDCEGQCLARSGTCAPAEPMFGCNDILTDSGQRMTLCRD